MNGRIYVVGIQLFAAQAFTFSMFEVFHNEMLGENEIKKKYVKCLLKLTIGLDAVKQMSTLEKKKRHS